MKDGDTALRLALALGPGLRISGIQGAGRPGLDPRERFARCWRRRERYLYWRDACQPAQLLSEMRRHLAYLRRVAGRVIFCDDVSYPVRLRRLPRPPQVLFVRGDLTVVNAPCVAVVGARAAYQKASQWAHDVAAQVAIADVDSDGGRSEVTPTVLSGGALGIDAAAHEGCLDAGGNTVAVLGSGLDRLYPSRNEGLFERIVDSGGALMTSFPPGSPPRRAHFPQRNGLLAALSKLVVVAEAQARSGALNTASWAYKLGVQVAAFPESAGCRRILVQGGIDVRRPADVVALLRGAPLVRRRSALPDSAAEALLDAIDQAIDPVGLSQRLGWPLARTAAVLLRLDLAGRVMLVSGGRYQKIC